jgi:hypothetical protein
MVKAGSVGAPATDAAVWYDSIYCLGTERDLQYCQVYGNGLCNGNDCSNVHPHTADLVVYCSVQCGSLAHLHTIQDYRLINLINKTDVNPGYFASILQVQVNGVWGTVCDKNIQNIHSVVCRLSGYSP